MPIKKHDRQYDLVVLGATGYTGSLTAEHIVANFPADLKWAVAGRSEAKLKKLVSECQALKPERTPPEIEVCSVDDEELGALARKTFCLITTLGPYARYGEPVFKACAEAGTHYLDCAGEVPFTMMMIQKYEATAKASGACMFPQSGIESGPSDLLTWALVSTIRSQLSLETADVVMDLHRLDSLPTGGTLVSLLGQLELYSTKVLRQAMTPFALSPVPNSHPGPRRSLAASATGVVRVPGLGLLTTSLTGPMNVAAVGRSWGLSKQDPDVPGPFYGPNFTYREFEKAGNLLTGVAAHYGLLLGIGLLLLPPLRSLLLRLAYKPGEGPDRAKARGDRIEFRAVARPDGRGGAGKQAFGRFEYTGSMYYLTALILAQGAATILEDDSVKLSGGIYTASCLGQGLVDRVVAAGVQLETEIRDHDWKGQ